MSDLPVIKPELLVGITMTQAQKDKWLEALRSGRYPQGKCCLHKNGKFCCLGVYAHAVCGFDPMSLLYTASLSGSLEINDLGEDFGNSVQVELASMNDNGQDFESIANFIEANIPACDAVKP
jgi:hypothetical protein